MPKLKQFTRKSLKKFDGKDGRPAYIAYKGLVFDVSDSRLWTGGVHQGHHSAGDEFAKGMENAPHGKEVLVKLRVVGELAIDESWKFRLVQRMLGFHLHPIFVHFSIAYSILVPLLTLMYLFTGEIYFDSAAYFLLLFGLLAAAFAGGSGFFSWKYNYHSWLSKIFSKKIAFTAILIAVSTVCLLWRTIDPNILIARTDLVYIYVALVVSFIPIVAIIGYYGGEIVYA
jgi:predicted heme/steroid binding protein/uncharacterized membrane protein